MTSPTVDTVDVARFPWVGLFTLSALIFVAVTSEFLPTGLLPEIANELDVSQSQVGLLVTVFAGTVVLTAAPLSVLTRRYSRKSLVMVVLVVFMLANVLAALAPSYAVLMAARVLGGLAHGLFWSVVGAYAAHLVPRHQLARAIAITGGGGTAAFVLGVPVGTAIGHVVGWRLAFAVIAGLVIVLALVAARFLPSVQHGVTLATGEIALPMRRDPTVPAVIAVGVILIVTILAHNVFYTYIAPYLLGPVGIDSGAVAGVLFFFGGAGAVGLVLAGAFGDRFSQASLVIAVVLVLISVLGIGIFPASGFVTLVLIAIWGLAFGAIPPLMQTRMMGAASLRVRDAASAYMTTSFNVAIGAGALVGGVLLDGWGIGSLPFVDAALTVVALILVVAAAVWLRHRTGAGLSLDYRQGTPSARV